MNINNIAHTGYEFEAVIKDIFSTYGYVTSYTDNQVDMNFDLYAHNNENKLAIEVKFSRNINTPTSLILNASNRLLSCTRTKKLIPVLVIAGIVSNKIREKLDDTIIICDIRNLLYLVQYDVELRKRLVSLLSFSVEDLELASPDGRLNFKSHPHKDEHCKIGELISNLENWNPSETKSTDYEDLCSTVLKFLFYDDLTLWQVQQESNDGLFRFDLICKIKDGVNKEFWNISERFFNTKYIVFEFKNYRDKITQKEIFTTEKYLYSKALRNIAILVSTNGADVNSIKAVRGTLRENGKLIILLTNHDLIEMLKQKLENVTPSDYLSEKLDQLLIDLEK